MRFFHGTDLADARRLIANEDLDPEAARLHKIDGEPGFFLATVESDGEFFAARRGLGAVITVDIEENAVKALEAGGAVVRRIRVTGGSPYFSGLELWIPLETFAIFNRLRSAGSIDVHT